MITKDLIIGFLLGITTVYLIDKAKDIYVYYQLIKKDEGKKVHRKE